MPNVSAGRRPTVIAALAAAIEAHTPLLDTHPDPDHNRTVFTFAGPQAQIRAAALALVDEAARLIDLRTHAGVHPRMGAVDVLPLIPLGAATTADGVALAHDLGRALGQRLPVYLYDAAHPQGRTLPQTRRPADQRPPPDFGPAETGPAGAVAVGVRPALIAFNVYLDTADVSIARRIARRIRDANGGIPAVRALGLPVGGRAQVSTNIVDHTRTTPLDVVEAVRALAADHGAAVHHSELVGLVPRRAAVEVERWQLDPPLGGRILEDMIQQVLGVDIGLV
ncbi:MAG: glutamate formiminotransferase [Anaerolineae bacterium]